MASDSLVTGQESPWGAGVTNSSSLFTPRFSSGLQDLGFLNQKWLIHPTCSHIPTLIFSPISPPFIFTFHAHTSQMMAVCTRSRAVACIWKQSHIYTHAHAHMAPAWPHLPSVNQSDLDPADSDGGSASALGALRQTDTM